MTAAKVQPISDLRAESIVLIALRNLRRAPWNARKTFEPAAIEQLRASIVAHGIQVPLIVRPKFDEQPNTYEIIAGHRRFEASLLGATPTGEAPCIVRDLDDDQAHEIALVDNLQREDVPALEEADAYAELQKRLGTPEAIAARVGKDVSYVARRLQLVSLAELPRRALAERLIAIDHALLLARLGVDEQNVNLKWCLNSNAGKQESVEKTIEYRIKDRDNKGRWSPWESQSVLELKHHIEQNVGRKLSRAPWSLDDPDLLPAAGACTTCPSNTKANTNLFSDLDITAATCEDGGCFEFKREAFVQIRQSKATHDQANGPNLAASVDPAIRISFRSTTVKPRVDKKTGTFSLAQTFKDGQWIEAKPKSCAYVRLGVTVDWSDDGNRGYMGSEKKLRKPGAILAVCIAEKCKAHRKTWEKAKSAQGSERGERVSPEQTEKLAGQREFLEKIEKEVRDRLLTAILEKLDINSAIRAVADNTHEAPEWRKHLLAAFPKAPGVLLEALTLFCCRFSRSFEPNGYWLLQDCRLNSQGNFDAAKKRPNVEKERKGAWALAKRVGLNPDAIVVEHFAEVGIAPAADCLYPTGPKAEKAWKDHVAARAAGCAKKKMPAKKAAKKGGRK